ncbi:MAG: hypothetical protein O2954_02320 [bacterium]|nr:hypothetical protein [bacterium]
MSNPLNLQFLYYFSSTSIHVLEVKINGLKEGTPPGKVYHWLCYDRTSQQFQKLAFKSMGSEGGREYRIFEQAELWFDASQANLKLQTGATSQEFTLDVKEINSIPDELQAQVQHFLQIIHSCTG